MTGQDRGGQDLGRGSVGDLQTEREKKTTGARGPGADQNRGKAEAKLRKTISATTATLVQAKRKTKMALTKKSMPGKMLLTTNGEFF